MTASESNAQWRDMTPLEQKLCKALGAVRYPVASPPKRLAKNLLAQAQTERPQITNKQAQVAWLQAWRYRRQIPSAELRVIAEAAHNLSRRTAAIRAVRG